MTRLQMAAVAEKRDTQPEQRSSRGQPSVFSNNLSEAEVSAEKPTYQRQSDHIARKAHRTFLIVAVCGVVGFILWSSLTTIDKVTRGAGRIVPLQQNQMVQHLEGGIISAIYAKEGDRVKKGDILLRVKNNFFKAELSQTELEHKARLVKLQRLQAESRGLDSFEVPDALAKAVPDLVKNERRLFQRRTDTLKGQIKIFDDQVLQKQLEFSEQQVLLRGKMAELSLLRSRVESNRRLAKVGAVSKHDLLKLETELQKVETRISGLELSIPRTEASLSEIRERRRDLLLRAQETAENERSQVEVELSKLEKTLSAMSDRNRRTDVRSPIDGTVNRLFVSTVGGVVRTGQNLVQIVPSETSIAVEAKLSPKDRAEVWPGLPGVIKISAYDYSTYGGLDAKITEISPDALQDKDGRPYFRVRLEANITSFGPNQPVVPGMLAEVDILTGKNTVMNYLLTPIRRLQEKALRQ